MIGAMVLTMQCFRNCAGNFVLGFEPAIHVNSNTMAEMWAVRDGLWVARRFGFANIVVETDSKFVFNALRRGEVQAGQLRRRSHEILVASEFSALQVIFCYRESNGVPDLLAKHVATTQGRFVLYSSAPDFMLEPMCKDQLGVVVPRFVKLYQTCYSFALI